MTDRVSQLAQTACDGIDALAEQWQAQDHGPDDPIAAYGAAMKANIGVDIAASVLQTLDPVEPLPDFDLVRTLRARLEIAPFDPARFATAAPVISKINHGFWEHLAFLHTRPERRDSYRDSNLEMRRRQYLSSDFLPVLLGTWMELIRDAGAGGFVSTTTGVIDFGANLGQAWTDPDVPAPEGYVLRPFHRGAVRGLLAFGDIARQSGVEGPLRYHDSVAINTGFQDGTLLGGIKGQAGPDTVALVMGPARLGAVRLAGWPGPQAFLGVSLHSAMAQWQFNLRNLDAVIRRYEAQGKDVVVFFQGGALGPVLAAWLRRIQPHLATRAGFVDLGRLMDLAFEDDVTRTGSPLPDGSFNSHGQLRLGTPPEHVFAAHAD